MSDTSQRVSWKQMLVPSTSVILWLAVFLGLFLSHQREELINTDGDICWHVAAGKWMMDHGEIIKADPFSHTRPNAPLITHDWGSEILFASVWKWLGWSGVAMVAAALIASLVWLLHRQLLAEGNGVVASTGLVFLAAMACSIHWLARPLLFTQILICAFHWQLRSFQRGDLSMPVLFVRLGVLTVVWVNLHGAFFAGFVLIGMYAVGAGLEWWRGGADPTGGAQKRTVGFVSVLVICLVASLANPNGWRLHAHIVEFLSSPLLTTVTPEFASPDFHSSGARGFLLILMLLAIVLIQARTQLSSMEFLVVGGWGLMALYSTRNIPVFAIVAVPILAGHVRQMVASRGISSPGSRLALAALRFNTVHANAGGTAWIVVVGVCLSLALVWETYRERGIFSTELRRDTFPVGAVDHLVKHESDLVGEMFNDYDWGGYLSIYLPARKVFTDGRNDFYGDELVKEYLRVAAVDSSWERIFDRYDVGWVIMPRESAIVRYLSLHPSWTVSYDDARVAVLVRAQ